MALGIDEREFPRPAKQSETEARRPLGRVGLIAAAVIGNALEWYDFIIYGLLAVTMAPLFFPNNDPRTSLLLTFATYGVGFLMRPIGALVLGIYADRVGRKAAITFTVGLMAMGTAMIGLAPSYATLGIGAPLLIVCARLIQGFSVGGELGGATAFLIEHAPAGHRSLSASWQEVSQALAVAFGAVVISAVAWSMTSEQLSSWGWRIPFLLGVAIGPIGLFLRSRLTETPDFLAIPADQRRASPIVVALRDYRGAFIVAMGLTVLYVASIYILLLYMPTYSFRQLGLNMSDALLGAIAGGFSLAIMCPIVGLICDRTGPKPLIMSGAVILAVAPYPVFAYLGAHPDLATLCVVQILLGVPLSLYTVPTLVIYARLFPPSIRSTGMSIAYNVIGTLVGGFAPFTVTWLIAATGNANAPAFYVIAAALVSLGFAITLKDGARTALSERSTSTERSA